MFPTFQKHYASDFHLLTSRELTSGFDFCSRDHLRVAVVNLAIKFGVDICIHCSPELLPLLRNSIYGGVRHLGFSTRLYTALTFLIRSLSVIIY